MSACESEQFLWVFEEPDCPTRTRNIYLSGEIESRSDATEFCNIMRTAKQGEEIKLYINSCGGDMWLGFQMQSALAQTKADVETIADSYVASAGVFLFLQAKKRKISKGTLFLVHYYTGAYEGKGQEIASRMSFFEQFMPNVFRENLSVLLDRDEMQRLIKGEDFWFCPDEVASRVGAEVLG